MAPTNVWMKRQIGGGLDEIELPNIPNPFSGILPSSTLSGTTASSTTRPSASSILSDDLEPTVDASTSVPLRPTESTSEEETESVQTSPSPTPTTEAILLTEIAPAPEVTSVATSEHVLSTHIQNKTVFVDSPATSGTPAPVGAKGNAFLDNKVLSGVVFAICGLVGLILIVLAIFFITRKARRTRKLEQEIISWDPDHVQGFNNNGTNYASNDGDARSVAELEEKGRGPSSLDGHYTYALPNQNPHVKSSAVPFANHDGAQRPIQITLPAGQPQPYRANW